MNSNTINVLINKLKQKEKNSRQYKQLVSRLIKSFKKEFKYRDIRNLEESKEKSFELSLKSDSEIIDTFKNKNLKTAFNQEELK